MSSIFKKVETENPEQRLRLNIVFNETDFTLVILEKSNAWNAQISWNDIVKLAKKLELDAEDYYSNLKLYLQDTPNNVHLKLTNKEFICYCNEDGINVKYFSCKPKKLVFHECVYDLLDSYAVNIHKNTLNQQEALELKRGYTRLEEKITELVDRNLSREEELYSNFVLVLNEKKRKIQQLTQILDALRAGRPVLNPEIKVKKQKPSKKEKNVKQKQELHISESESSNNSDAYNTDDEQTKKAENIIDDVLPSTSKKHTYDSIFNESDDLVGLPKRQKKTEEFKEVRNSLEQKNVQKIDTEITDVSSEDDNPKETFNTQDLLDCI